MTDYYCLTSDNEAVPCDVETWSKQLETMRKADSGISKHVADEIVNERRISTVFLGLNHAYTKEESPKIFETMIFEPNSFSEIYCDRYSTWDEAVGGHERAKQRFLAGEINND